MPLDGSYADLMDQHGFIPANHAAPVFFPVEALKLYDERGEVLPDYKRIVRMDTGKTLNVTTDSYTVVTNEEAFGAFEVELRNSKLDLAGMRIGTDYARDGARVFRQYLLPAHQVEVKPGVAVALRLIMMNSYDGSMRFQGRAGAYNFVCANTSIAGTDIAGFKVKHTGEIDLSKAIGSLVAAAEAHVIETGTWKAWPHIKITDLGARALIQALPGGSRTLVDHLVHRYLVARDTDEKQGGNNVWCLFNVLTAWATHGEVDAKGGSAQIKADREASVRKLTELPMWKQTIEGKLAA